MANSNHARDAYINKEQDKFFRRVNRQWANIDALKERMERSELRARALELENKSLLAHLDSMVDKLYFCTQAEVTSQVVGSNLSNWRKTDVIPFRLTKLSLSLSMLMSLRTTRHISKPMLSQAFQSRALRSIQQTFPLWFQLH